MGIADRKATICSCRKVGSSGGIGDEAATEPAALLLLLTLPSEEEEEMSRLDAREKLQFGRRLLARPSRRARTTKGKFVAIIVPTSVRIV
jgi:hypothetical protein